MFQVLLYATALREVVDEHGLSAKANGTLIVDQMRSRTIAGVSGMVSINKNGDRSVDYALLDLNPDSHDFEVRGFVVCRNKNFSFFSFLSEKMHVVSLGLSSRTMKRFHFLVVISRANFSR